MTKASDNAFPSILITEGTEPTAPAAGKQRLYIDSTSHKLKATNSSGTDRTLEGVTSGTSNPGSPSDGDLFYRTDLDLLIRYRSSGTRWVCACQHVTEITHDGALPISTTPTGGRTSHPGRSIGLDIFIEDFWSDTLVLTTNDGTKYWTIALDNPAGGAALATLSTISNAPNAVVLETATIDTVVTDTNWLTITCTRVGSTPGNLYAPACILWRYIVT